jgi:hypothetical protein
MTACIDVHIQAYNSGSTDAFVEACITGYIDGTFQAYNKQTPLSMPILLAKKTALPRPIMLDIYRHL